MDFFLTIFVIGLIIYLFKGNKMFDLLSPTKYILKGHVKYCTFHLKQAVKNWNAGDRLLAELRIEFFDRDYRRFKLIYKNAEKRYKYSQLVDHMNELVELRNNFYQSTIGKKYSSKSRWNSRTRAKNKSLGYPRNAYKVLGVEHPATEIEIKKAYRKLANIHHPDKGGSEYSFNQVNEAYEVAINFVQKANI